MTKEIFLDRCLIWKFEKIYSYLLISFQNCNIKKKNYSLRSDDLHYIKCVTINMSRFIVHHKVTYPTLCSTKIKSNSYISHNPDKLSCTQRFSHRVIWSTLLHSNIYYINNSMRLHEGTHSFPQPMYLSLTVNHCKINTLTQSYTICNISIISIHQIKFLCLSLTLFFWILDVTNLCRLYFLCH